MTRKSLYVLLLAALSITLAACDPDPINPEAYDNGITVSSTLTPDNGAIVITKAASRTAGWLVIRRDNGSNAPLMSEDIGRVALPIGVSANVTVPLSIEATNGQKLWATLHVDDGATGVYEFTGAGSPDQLAVDSNDVEIKTSFTISRATPAITVNDQIPSNGAVAVNVTAAENGWVVIASSNTAGNASTIIGTARVNAGANAVNIKLDTSAARAVNTGDKLWATLHVDRGAEGTFEFPGADFEVKVSGSSVSTSFTVNGAPPQVVTTPKRIVNQSVIVDRVDAAHVGWIVIHETDTNGDPILGTSVGRARVGIGGTITISVPLDKTIAAGTLLVAMLHRDDPVVGRYDYVSSGSLDAPVIDPSTSFPVQFEFRILQ